MIHINLLPPSYRKKTHTTVEQFHRTPLALLVAVLLVGGYLCAAAATFLNAQRVEHLQGKVDALEPKKNAVNELRSMVEHLRQYKTTFGELKQGQNRWSKRLNTLSDVTPVGIWFRDLALDRDKGLVIQGSAIAEGGDEMVRVGELVQRLKDDHDFASVVKDIQIEQIKRRQDGEVEVVDFTLMCRLTGASNP